MKSESNEEHGQSSDLTEKSNWKKQLEPDYAPARSHSPESRTEESLKLIRRLVWWVTDERRERKARPPIGTPQLDHAGDKI